MIRKEAYGLSPSFNLIINNVPVDYQALNKIEIHLAENQHDLTNLEIVGLPPRAVTEYLNQAVQLHIDTGANYQFDFVGYVTDVRPEAKTYQSLINDSPFQNAVVMCMGASYIMRGAKSRVWTGYGLLDVAKELASTYRFSLDVPQELGTRGTLVQAQESDWQFLVRCCTVMGYAVTVHGTHLHIFDPHNASDRATSFNKLITVRLGRGNPRTVPGLISEFRGSFSEHHADGLYKNTVVRVRQGTTEFDVTTQDIKGIDGTPRFENRINDYAANYDEAVRLIDAASKDAYDYTATAVVAGMAGCVPGGVVQLDNYNAHFDGLWYVREVQHSLSSGAFVTTLSLARNISSQLEQFSHTEKYTFPPTPRFVGTRWEATKRSQNVYL